jgi:hypothetical protein
MFTTDFPRPLPMPKQARRNARRRGAVLVAAATLTAAAAVATSVPAQASGGQNGRGVRASSPCATGVIKVKAKHDAALLDVGTELSTGVAGQTWTVTFSDNGVAVWTGKVKTAPVIGALAVAHPMPDLVGADVVTVTAVRGLTTCSVQVTA